MKRTGGTAIAHGTTPTNWFLYRAQQSFPVTTVGARKVAQRQHTFSPSRLSFDKQAFRGTNEVPRLYPPLSQIKDNWSLDWQVKSHGQIHIAIGLHQNELCLHLWSQAIYRYLVWWRSPITRLHLQYHHTILFIAIISSHIRCSPFIKINPDAK